MTLFRKSKSKGDLQQDFQTTVRFLDDSEPIHLPFTKETTGQYVLEKVCETLNLIEKDYFGLRFVDSEKQRHWLDPQKTVYKQLKGVSPCVLCFRVKFYPADPMKLHEEITRYYLFLQLRRDLHHGRLLCSPQDANLLAAYIIQSELGDYDIQDHPAGYVAEFKMLPNQNVEQEQRIHELHQSLMGQVPAEAEANFLKKASSLDTYGVDPHKVKDQKGLQMYLGVTHQGIMTFQGNRRTQIYKWSQVKKLAFEGKTFIAHVNINEDPESPRAKKKHQPVGYKCLTVAACKYLWKCAVEQQLFFTLQNSFHPPKLRSGGSLFSRGSKFRFSGRCQNEAYQASDDIKRKEPDFQRTCSLPNFARKTDAKIYARNSANMSITEDKGGRGFKADTLPRMTSEPSVSVKPDSFEIRRNSKGSKENIRSGSQSRRRNSDGSSKKRSSREFSDQRGSQDELQGRTNGVPIQVQINGDKKPDLDGKRDEHPDMVPMTYEDEPHVIEPHVTPVKAQIEQAKQNFIDGPQKPDHQWKAERPSSFDATKATTKPKLKEMARYSMKEVTRYTEVEQRQTVRELDPVVTMEAKPATQFGETKPVKVPVEVVTPPVTNGLSPKENAVDVPIEATQAAKVAGAPRVPTEASPVVEEMVAPSQVADVESRVNPNTSKQNGGIPIIVTTDADAVADSKPVDSNDSMTPPYEPNQTMYDQEDDSSQIARSLEEQIRDLEKEVEQMESNHTDTDRGSSQTVPADNKPGSAAGKKGGCSCGKVFAYTFFTLFLTLTVSICVVMFSDIDHPVAAEMRNQLTFLEPTRDFILHQYQNLVNKL